MNWPRIHIIFFLVCFVLSASGQQWKYTVANAHSHNDYVHPEPFYTAYDAGFGSIEVDIHLRNGWLYVAHDSSDIRDGRTLTSLYLDPLSRAIIKNRGSVYPQKQKQLILLVDIKTAAEPTLNALVVLFGLYSNLVKCRSLKIVITGNRPPPGKWTSYPKWLYFDGRLKENYTATELSRVAIISDNFRNYSAWRGEGAPGEETMSAISAAVNKAHKLKKPIRFWATPDNVNAWQLLMHLDVDYINTDKLTVLAQFLGNKRN